MEIGLFQRQTLKTVMTTELRQGITLLQYNAQELTNFLYEKSLENPLIELKDRRKTVKKGKEFSFERYSDKKQSLSQHLLSQLGELSISKQEEKLVSFFIHNLTPEGYLKESIEELMMLTGVGKEEVEKAVSVLQQLDPAGVGASDVKDCLRLQLIHQKERNHLAENIITNHFNCFLKKNYRKIAQSVEKEENEVRVACEVIVSLDPKPGLRFNVDSSIYIVPDLRITKENGHYYVSVSGSGYPKIQLCDKYTDWRALLKKEGERYLNEKYNEYQWILKSLEYRHQTLLSVANIIVQEQREFLERGPLFLKPLTLKDLACLLEVHESTISRTIRNKYIQTPFGVFELKYFFNGAISSAGADNVSNKSVKELIKKIISEEDKTHPLSDQQLVHLLDHTFQIKVARRTVTKYREAYFIPSSKQRKKG